MRSACTRYLVLRRSKMWKKFLVLCSLIFIFSSVGSSQDFPYNAGTIKKFEKICFQPKNEYIRNHLLPLVNNEFCKKIILLIYEEGLMEVEFILAYFYGRTFDASSLHLNEIVELRNQYLDFAEEAFDSGIEDNLSLKNISYSNLHYFRLHYRARIFKRGVLAKVRISISEISTHMYVGNHIFTEIELTMKNIFYFAILDGFKNYKQIIMKSTSFFDPRVVAYWAERSIKIDNKYKLLFDALK